MKLTAQQKAFNDNCRVFSDKQIAPLAQQIDQEECMPLELLQTLAQEKYLGSILPKEVGGLGADMVSFGLLNEQIGRGCSSVRSLLTVHSMVSYSVLRWGTREQKDSLLPQLATGGKIGAFALTEPNVGSDSKSIESTATKYEDGYVLNGRKKWITCAQIADVFLLFAKYNDQPMAFLVDRHTPGLEITPIRGLLGTRGSMLGELYLKECKVPRANVIGGEGFGFLGVALSALNIGRSSVAWGCVGIGQACLEASLKYIGERKQFGVLIEKHQLIQQMITNMYTDVKSARLLCYHASHLQDAEAINATQETLVAKYAASTMANRAARDAVQVHGANGCALGYPVERYFRDAKVMELIEGSTQMQQIMIANHAFQRFSSGHALDDI
jgi:glutaryl-CoA dehydrogenase (non-decarboxylating)